MKNECLKCTPISLCVFSYSKKWYLTHPWLIVKDLWRGAKNFYHRGRYGYAWVDLWNTNTYLTELTTNMIEQLAERANGWPQCDEWPEFEDWIEELRALSRVMRLLIPDYMEYKKWDNQIEFLYNEVGETPNRIDKYRFTEKEKLQIGACKKNFVRQDKERSILAHKVFAQLEHMWGGLWD